MADYYTQFSVCIPVAPAHIGAVRAWYARWEEQADAAEVAFHGDEEDADEAVMAAYGGSEDAYYARCRGFGRSLESADDGRLELLVSSDEGCGNVEGAVGYLAEMLAACMTDNAVFLSWANSCSKPRSGAFGGGGVVIRGNGDHVWAIDHGAIEAALEGGLGESCILGA
jgi:hypothetical protein